MSKWSLFKTLFAMQYKNYIRDKFNLFSGWFVTIITLVGWLTFRDTTNSSLTYDPFVLASALGVCGIRNCMYNFVKTIHEFKQKDFFNRLFSTNTSKKFIFMVMVLFNLTANAVVTLVTLAIAMLYPEQRETIKHVNWPIFLVGYVLLLILSNLMAFLIAFWVKSLEWCFTIGNFYYFGSVYLLGLGIPYNVLVSEKWVIYVSYLFPQRYMVNIMCAGWINAPDFKYVGNNGAAINFGYGEQAWIPYVVSIVIILTLSVLVYKMFKKVFEFENRKYRKFKNQHKHMAIIYAINRSSSLEELESLIEVRDNINLNKSKLNNTLKDLKHQAVERRQNKNGKGFSKTRSKK
ncbi:ABC transporter permease [Spiroplasma gladiatoris]|uniref:ABC transporter permease n=1 Tax=Spiroplasma gladiatoris TaxID=2143 RepID=A0A4P7AHM3_9MOLU|nr:ABC transporter permease [Spiroplasma gladiatoris]QBQ07935.1 ABC transporter permease [Spiroplasma gladiatoris]